MKKIIKAPYFHHDNNARDDEKIIKMVSEMTWESYGLYWGIIERLHQSSDGWLDDECVRIAFALRSECDKIKKIIHDFGLFIFDEKRFTSERLQQEIIERKLRSAKSRLAAEKRWADYSGNANAYALASDDVCKPNAIIKEKKRKEKNNGTVSNGANAGPVACFEALWAQYPKRDGRKEALRHFLASVKNRQDWDEINKALKNYLESDAVKKNFIKNGSTWFNNWRDWVDMPGAKSGPEVI